MSDESLEERLANRREPGDPDYDAFYDATDEELAEMIPPGWGVPSTSEKE